MAVRLLAAWEKRSEAERFNGEVPSVGQSVRLGIEPLLGLMTMCWTWLSLLWSPLWRVSMSFVSNHTNVYRITTNLRRSFLHVFPNWKFGPVLNSMYYFSLRKSREYHFPRTSGLTRRAVNLANKQVYLFAVTFPLPIPFWKCGSSYIRGRPKF
jgi:hypothetical protein